MVGLLSTDVGGAGFKTDSMRDCSVPVSSVQQGMGTRLAFELKKV